MLKSTRTVEASARTLYLEILHTFTQQQPLAKLDERSCSRRRAKIRRKRKFHCVFVDLCIGHENKLKNEEDTYSFDSTRAGGQCTPFPAEDALNFLIHGWDAHKREKNKELTRSPPIRDPDWWEPYPPYVGTISIPFISTTTEVVGHSDFPFIRMDVGVKIPVCICI